MSLLVNEIKDEIALLESKKKLLAGKKLKKLQSIASVKTVKNKPRYFLKTNKDDTFRYCGKDRIEEVRFVIQNEYDLKMIKEINLRLHNLKKILTLYSKNNVYDVYENLHPARKLLVKPIVQSNDEFINIWKKEHIPNGTYIDNGLETNSGAVVRSKSEKIISDALCDNKIIFVYETPIKKNGCIILLPDFTILDNERKRTIYWEHFGMMDKPEYRERTIQKLLMYIEMNIIPGQNLIITCEGSKTFNTRQVLENIKAIREGKDFEIPDLISRY